jgi:hypothetical protein
MISTRAARAASRSSSGSAAAGDGCSFGEHAFKKNIVAKSAAARVKRFIEVAVVENADSTTVGPIIEAIVNPE